MEAAPLRTRKRLLMLPARMALGANCRVHVRHRRVLACSRTAERLRVPVPAGARRQALAYHWTAVPSTGIDGQMDGRTEEPKRKEKLCLTFKPRLKPWRFGGPAA